MRTAKTRGILALLLILVSLSFLSTAEAASIPCEWTGVEKIVTIGDLHGDYQNFLKILIGTQVVDDDLHWAAGKTHLVQTGDVLDRGAGAKQIFDLLIRLEKEAEAAGGMVHVLLGNHEEMNIGGIVFSYSDYVTLDQFISFLPEAYKLQQEEVLRKKVQKLLARDPNTRLDKVLNEFWDALKDDPRGQKIYLDNFNKEYGSWLLQHNVAIKINDVVFVHGGISEKYSKWGLAEINERYRLELADRMRAIEKSENPRIVQTSIFYKGDSPLWYRELATVPEEQMKEEVDAILANLGAKHMVIAHTPKIAKEPKDMQRFGGKVWIVDTGISRIYGGPSTALLIINGDFNVWGVGHDQASDSDFFTACYLPLWPGVFSLVPTGQ
jgi:hypothetical protein